MKDTECRQQVQCIETNLESEAMFRRDSDNELYKELNALNTRMSKTEKQVKLLNSQCDSNQINQVIERINELENKIDFIAKTCTYAITTDGIEEDIRDLKNSIKERTKFVNTIIDRHSNEVLNTRVKLDRHVDEQVGALANSVTPKGTLPECFHRPNGSYKPNRKLEPADVVYPCYASSSELEKDAVIKKLKCLGTVYDFSDVIILNISPENLIKVNIHEYVASCNYRVNWIGIHTDNKNIQIDFRRNGE